MHQPSSTVSCVQFFPALHSQPTVRLDSEGSFACGLQPEARCLVNREVVTLGRFELPTCGLGNRRSIHLSYRAIYMASLLQAEMERNLKGRAKLRSSRPLCTLFNEQQNQRGNRDRPRFRVDRIPNCSPVCIAHRCAAAPFALRAAC
jgi:hypothetical protein